MARVLPGALAGNDLIARMITPAVSETQVFRYEDLVLHRPAAPFAYTNAWGSSFALLTPFVIAAIHDRRIGIPRTVLVPLLAAGLVPLSVALNRGSWLTLGVGLAYGVVRWARVRGDSRPLVVAGLLVAAGLAVTSLTGVLDSSFQQLETRSADSNETRSSLYIETITAAAESPLIGHGSTRPSLDNPTGPPLGTHGQLWAVLFAHGYLGALLYVGFFASAFLRCRSREPVQHWTRVVLLVGLLQLPIYGHLPHQLFILVGAAALASWPAAAAPSRP
jgi:O-antigen ligase